MRGGDNLYASQLFGAVRILLTNKAPLLLSDCQLAFVLVQETSITSKTGASSTMTLLCPAGAEMFEPCEAGGHGPGPVHSSWRPEGLPGG